MKKFIYAVLSFSPMLAMAATAPDLSGISGLITNIGGILNKIIPLFVALAIIFFFWGLVQFLRSAGNKEKHEEGKNHMIYGVIAIAVMISLFGLITWLQNTLGVSSGGSITVPIVPGL